jgi:hypothetical protein
MSDDADSPTRVNSSAVATPPGREVQRAEALRANLMRRKAQARERSEIPDISIPKPGVSMPKAGGDA